MGEGSGCGRTGVIVRPAVCEGNTGRPAAGDRATAGVLAAMVARELESLATVRSDADGRRLRILMRMADRAMAPA